MRNFPSTLLLVKAFCLFADRLVFGAKYPKSQGGQSGTHALAKVTLKSWTDLPAFTFPVPRLQRAQPASALGRLLCALALTVHGALASIPEQGPSVPLSPTCGTYPFDSHL